MSTEMPELLTPDTLKKYDPSEYIIIKGAKLHNLKDVNIAIPKHHLIVVTGVSGSGKSSLCIDTLFAEGQRRYVESLSSYARQFLNRMNKPEVDYIKGICPAIAIEQNVSNKNSRSTVGSLTEIYDYLRLLFARIGKTFSPISNQLVKKNEVSDIVDFVAAKKVGTKVQIFFPQKIETSLKDELQLLLQKGFTRFQLNDELLNIEDYLESEKKSRKKIKEIWVLVDRLAVGEDHEELASRLADSIQIAFYESLGDCIIDVIDGETRKFSNRFELDGMLFEQPTPHFFNFNNPFGACKTCEGFGTIIGVDRDLVIPNKSLSVYDGAIACWRGEKMQRWLRTLVKNAIHFDFPIHRDYQFLTDEEKELLWTGNDYFKGLNEFFKYLEEKTYKIQYRVLLSRYRGRTACPDCNSSRLRKDSQYVKVGGKNINELLLSPVNETLEFFQDLELSDHDAQVAKQILIEINNRLFTMVSIGLGYLSLNRISSTLSGGESQRINLTRSLGSNLTDSLYILDEPSIGLHPKDTDRLIDVLQSLKELGNSVLVVEHDEEMIRAADHLIDMGPHAGRYGGEVIFSGPAEEILGTKNSLTAEYLSGQKSIEIPDSRRKGINFIEVKGASQFNLKNIDVKFPLNTLVVVTGVSGSGKTTLVKKILYPYMKRELEGVGEKPGAFNEIVGDLHAISQVEYVDQNPLGRSSRSNPVTYIKAYDAIREHFSKAQLSKIRGYKPKHFSFNVDGGRCEACKGEGEVVVEMQFLADIHLVCESCKGRRFKNEVLEVMHKDKNIFDVLDMSVDEAIEFFADEKDICTRLQPLQDIGLGYIKLGQSSSTLSGGEAQRVKLASFLGKGKATQPVLFIFDEPTTGLHFHDITKLLAAFDQLISLGHTIIVIEHNIDVIKCADWLIDLGPEGGKHGGTLMYQGVPEGLPDVSDSHTAKYLSDKLN